MPVSMRLEADAAVDDIVVELAGGTAYIQAKTRLDFGRTTGSSMRSVIAQWIKLAAETDLDPDRDRIVAVAAESSRAVRDFGLALRRRRRRVPGVPSIAETEAIPSVEAMLGDRDEVATDRILDCAVVWLVDLEDIDGLSARLGQALLEPGVVARDEGLRAWTTLRETARGLARRRWGATLKDLIAALADGGLTLTADGAGHASAQQEQRRIKLDACRERIRCRGETLDLRGIAAPLPRIRPVDGDAYVGVSTMGASQSPGRDHIAGDRDLIWALRRRGRAVLVGLPGSGKSVALRAAAAGYAGRPSWPLPLVVPLDRVARLRRAMGFDDALLEAALEDEPPEDRAQLRVAAIEALHEGTAAIFFDALDETRTARHAITGDLETKLRDLHPAVEVLMTTRDVAYADAHTLHLSELRLLAPEHPMHTVRAILGAVADERQLHDTHRRTWIQERVEWVETQLLANSGLRETPLVVVLLAMLTTEHTVTDLPSTRASALVRVLDDVVTRWEARRRLGGEPPRLGSLTDGDGTAAARQAFVVIGHQLFDQAEPSRAAVLARLADAFVQSFGLARQPAMSVAEHALSLWDEAGVFIISASTGRVQARLRSFAELAEANHVAALDPEDQRTWTQTALRDEDTHEAALLAAGLSPVVGDELLAGAITDFDNQPILEFVREAARQRAAFTDDRVAELVDALMTPPGNDREHLERALILIELPVGTEHRSRALGFLDELPDERRTILRAIAVESWRRTDPAVRADPKAMAALEPTRAIGARLGRGGVFGRRTRSASGVTRRLLGRLRRHRPDPLYWRAMVVVADNLDRAGAAEVASQLAQLLHRGMTADAGNRISRQLIANGFEHLVREADEELLRAGPSEQTAAMFREHAEIEEQLLRIIGELGSVVDLEQMQRRRLDDLANLIETSRFGRGSQAEVSGGVRSSSERLRTVLRAATLFAGQSLDVVASEAQQVLEETADEEDSYRPFSMLWDEARTLRLGDWSRLPDPGPTADALADAMFSSYAWIAELALECLESAPRDVRERAVARLDDRLDCVRARSLPRCARSGSPPPRSTISPVLETCSLSRPIWRSSMCCCRAATALNWRGRSGSNTSSRSSFSPPATPWLTGSWDSSWAPTTTW